MVHDERKLHWEETETLVVTSFISSSCSYIRASRAVDRKQRAGNSLHKVHIYEFDGLPLNREKFAVRFSLSFNEFSDSVETLRNNERKNVVCDREKRLLWCQNAPLIFTVFFWLYEIAQDLPFGDEERAARLTYDLREYEWTSPPEWASVFKCTFRILGMSKIETWRCHQASIDDG